MRLKTPRGVWAVYPITNFGMVEKMQDRDFFVSHALYTRRIDGKLVPAYRLYRLKGSPESRAETIRKRMVEAKITMLQEVIAHPYCQQYLCCRRDLIDYTTPINERIEIIRQYPDIRKNNS